MRFVSQFRYFAKGSPKHDKRILLPIALSVLLLLSSMFMQVLHRDKVVMAINENIENRTFTLTYPLDKDIQTFIRTFSDNTNIVELKYIESMDFGVYVIQYVLDDYWHHERLKEQFKSYSGDIHFGEQKMDIESSLLVKFSEHIRIFLVLTQVLALLMIVANCFKILRDKWHDVRIYLFLGYHPLHLSALLTWYLLLCISPGVLLGLVMFYGFYSFL